MIPVWVTADPRLTVTAVPPEVSADRLRLAESPCPVCDGALGLRPIVCVVVGFGEGGHDCRRDGARVVVHSEHVARFLPTDLSALPDTVDDPNASITVAEVLQPLDPSHPMASTPCPVCNESLATGTVALVVVGITLYRAGSGGRTPGAAVPVHTKCVG